MLVKYGSNLKRIIMFGLVIAILFSVSMTSVSAANRTNTSYKFVFSAKVTDYEHSKWRNKTNKTKVYCKVNKVSTPGDYVKGWVQGKQSSGSTKYYNCSGGYYYKLNSKGEKWFTNYVKENGYNYARIAAEAKKERKNTIEGVWSPDSGK